MRCFLSYSRDDADFIEQVRSSAQRHGVEILVDTDNIREGEEWRTRLAEMIAECDSVLVIISERSVSSTDKDSAVSHAMTREVNMAADLKKPLLPVLLDSSRMPDQFKYALSGVHAIDCRRGMEALERFFGRNEFDLSAMDQFKRLPNPDVVVRKVISASRQIVYATATDYKSYPLWHTSVRDVRITAVDEANYVTTANWGVSVLARSGWVRYTVDYEYDAPRAVRWTARPTHIIREMTGTFEFFEISTARTQVVCSLRLRTRFMPKLIEQQLALQITSRRLDDLKRQSEILDTQRGRQDYGLGWDIDSDPNPPSGMDA
jgi:uncharacterized protein YndB with AHSA1/START domain